MFEPSFKDGEEVLTVFRGKWVHVKWNGDVWSLGCDATLVSLGYDAPFVLHYEGREYAPLPDIQASSIDFYSE